MLVSVSTEGDQCWADLGEKPGRDETVICPQSGLLSCHGLESAIYWGDALSAITWAGRFIGNTICLAQLPLPGLAQYCVLV